MLVSAAARRRAAQLCGMSPNRLLFRSGSTLVPALGLKHPRHEYRSRPNEANDPNLAATPRRSKETAEAGRAVADIAASRGVRPSNLEFRDAAPKFFHLGQRYVGPACEVAPVQVPRQAHPDDAAIRGRDLHRSSPPNSAAIVGCCARSEQKHEWDL